MKIPLESLERQAKSVRNFDSPPLELWNPPLSGDIPIQINAQGHWYHDGSKIERQSLVKLFASILRREEDGEYYLLTPSEKWRIEVERHPLSIVDFDVLIDDGVPSLMATLNIDRQVLVGDDYPLFLDSTVGDIVGVKMPHGITALCSRSAWIRLVGLATDINGTMVVSSGVYTFSLGAG